MVCKNKLHFGCTRSYVFKPDIISWRYVANKESLTHNKIKPWIITSTWWRHQMETFSALLTLCAGNSPVTGEFPAQRPMTRSFNVFFDLRLNKRLSKQSWGWWFETLLCPLWRHDIQLWGILTHPVILDYSRHGYVVKSQRKPWM